MSEEQTISTEDPTPVPVKEAEVKLKEMSRKAKERKTVSKARNVRPPKQGGSNLRMVLIGGFGIGVLGILYLMLRPGEEEFVSEHEVPQQSDTPKKPVQSSKEFEMNSF